MGASKSFVSILDPDAYDLLLRVSAADKESISATLRKLVILGMGGTLDDARIENERMAIRQALSIAHVRATQPEVDLSNPRAKSGTNTTGNVHLRLSKEWASTFRAWVTHMEQPTKSAAIRLAVSEGLHRVPL